MRYNTIPLKCHTKQYNAVQHNTPQCHTTQWTDKNTTPNDLTEHNTTQRAMPTMPLSTVQYSITLCSTVRHTSLIHTSFVSFVPTVSKSQDEDDEGTREVHPDPGKRPRSFPWGRYAGMTMTRKQLAVSRSGMDAGGVTIRDGCRRHLNSFDFNPANWYGNCPLFASRFYVARRRVS